MTTQEQIRTCQQPKLSYWDAFGDAHQRLRKGQVQKFCQTCQRWQWKDYQCSLFRDGTGEQYRRFFEEEIA